MLYEPFHPSRRPLRVAVLCSLLACGTLFAAGPPEDPAVVQSRLRSLYSAAQQFKDATGQAPLDPDSLFPEYVRDPRTFWNPGDIDSAPTTIDNALPDTPNSARISFWWGDQEIFPPFDRPAIEDNTPDNNDGTFIHRITISGAIEPFPQGIAVLPSPVTLAQGRMRMLLAGLLLDGKVQDDTLPGSLAEVWNGGFAMFPQTFWHPGDSDPPPTEITNSRPDGVNSAQISFEYLGGGLVISKTPPDTMILRDNTPDNNDGLGINVIRIDGHVELILDGNRGDPNADCHIDRTDWQILHACVTGAIYDDHCRYLNFVRDGRLDLLDVAGYMQSFTGSRDVIPDCLD